MIHRPLRVIEPLLFKKKACFPFSNGKRFYFSPASKPINDKNSSTSLIREVLSNSYTPTADSDNCFAVDWRTGVLHFGLINNTETLPPTGGSVSVPPPRLERGPLPSEGNALSAELWGQLPQRFYHR